MSMIPKLTIGMALALSLYAGRSDAASFGETISAGAPSEASDPDLAADRRLLAFDRTHPRCALWTDWWKLCSRMGPGGATTCRNDNLHSATPSEPFCAVGQAVANDTPAQQRSRFRFCRHRGPDGTQCGEYAADRPFGGENFAQMANRDCLAWGLGSQDGQICRTDVTAGANNPLSCASLAVARRRMTYPFVCVVWSKTSACAHPVGGLRVEGPTWNGISVQGLRPLSSEPVWGVWCDASNSGH